jgi:tRNA threonylcarbamoyladenosine biosynthesis protein TsaB
MPLILSLETSTDVCSVALHDSKSLLSHAEIREPQAHAASLAPLISKVVSGAGVDMEAIDAVAITSGPGSYTGLRIGTSTAKGLCYTLDIPLISIGTLALLAYQGSAHNVSQGLLCPMIDARRMEVYCLVADESLKPVQPVSAKVVDENSFLELLHSRKMLFFGNGAAKCREVIRHPNAFFIPDIYPQAMCLGVLAAEKFIGKEFEDLVAFQPFYLKEFLAKKSPGLL